MKRVSASTNETAVLPDGRVCEVQRGVSVAFDTEDKVDDDAAVKMLRRLGDALSHVADGRAR